MHNQSKGKEAQWINALVYYSSCARLGLQIEFWWAMNLYRADICSWKGVENSSLTFALLWNQLLSSGATGQLNSAGYVFGKFCPFTTNIVSMIRAATMVGNSQEKKIETFPQFK